MTEQLYEEEEARVAFHLLQFHTLNPGQHEQLLVHCLYGHEATKPCDFTLNFVFKP